MIIPEEILAKYWYDNEYNQLDKTDSKLCEDSRLKFKKWLSENLKPDNHNCSSCKFWRDKGWVGDDGIGICDNTNVIKQVSILNEDSIKTFIKGDNEADKKSNARFISNSLRFKSNFGCIHHENIKL